MTHCIVRLKPKEDNRILAGHLWVFSNEVSKMDGSASAGDVVEVRSSKNTSLGFGFYNPKTLIAVRIIAKEFIDPDKDFFVNRLVQALSIRERLFDSPFYRLCYGESDFLPGLTIDRFGNLFSVQILSVGMEKRKEIVYKSLEELFSPEAIYERNESQTRELEGLGRSKAVVLGAEKTVDYDEAGVNFRINPFRGQKTGFYYDQRSNRVFSRRFAKESRVLDLFANEGGFALGLARAGAREVVAVDSSGPAIETLVSNSVSNELAQVTALTSDVHAFLSRAAADNEKFDVIVCDPPSFTKNRKSVTAAKAGYKQLHRSIFALLNPNGILLTASCSHHIFRETFDEIVDETARRNGRTLQLLHRAGASPDHPVLPSMPETEYLKFNAYRVL